MEKYFDYLDDLKDSGETNMYGAIPYLQQQFPELREDAAQAQIILRTWMDHYRTGGEA